MGRASLAAFEQFSLRKKWLPTFLLRKRQEGFLFTGVKN
jgi:hypothetical protein